MQQPTRIDTVGLKRTPARCVSPLPATLPCTFTAFAVGALSFVLLACGGCQTSPERDPPPALPGDLAAMLKASQPASDPMASVPKETEPPAPPPTETRPPAVIPPEPEKPRDAQADAAASRTAEPVPPRADGDESVSKVAAEEERPEPPSQLSSGGAEHNPGGAPGRTLPPVEASSGGAARDGAVEDGPNPLEPKPTGERSGSEGHPAGDGEQQRPSSPEKPSGGPPRRSSSVDLAEIPDLPAPPPADTRARPEGVVRAPKGKPHEPAAVRGRWRQDDDNNRPDFLPGGYESSTLIFRPDGILEVQRAFGENGAILQTWRVGYDWSKDKSVLTLGRDPEFRPPPQSLRGFKVGKAAIRAATESFPVALRCSRRKDGSILLDGRAYVRLSGKDKKPD